MSDQTKTPIDFEIPASARTALVGFSGSFSSIAWYAAEQLESFGLPEDQAMSLVTDMMVAEAAGLALYVASTLHEREPDRDRWLQVCADTFDRVSEQLRDFDQVGADPW